jgi:hypothetical protein
VPCALLGFIRHNSLVVFATVVRLGNSHLLRWRQVANIAHTGRMHPVRAMQSAEIVVIQAVMTLQVLDLHLILCAKNVNPVVFPYRIKGAGGAQAAPYPQQKVQIVQPLAPNVSLEHFQEAVPTSIVKAARHMQGNTHLFMVHRFACYVL